MKPLPMSLKIRLFILATIFPIAFCWGGIIVGKNSLLFGIEFINPYIVSIFGLVGFSLGVLLNIVCYYRKLFVIAIYQTPIPLILFFVFRWISGFFVGNYLAIAIGLLGLLLGLWLNKELVLPYQFYKVPKRILAILYLLYSVITMGIFMGVPVFNIFLGLFAGNYLAARIISYTSNKQEISKNINQGAWFSALTILIISIFAALIALNDVEAYVNLVAQLTKIKLNPDLFVQFLTGITITTTILQYLITRFSAETMLALFNHRKS